MKEVDELYGEMLAVFEEKTGFTMDDTADLAVRLYAAAAQIQTLYAYSDWAVNQSFPRDGDRRVSGLPRGAERDHEKGGDEGERLAAVPAGCCAGG